MNPRLLLLSVFGLGHLRPASGTWGSMPAAALALLLATVIGPHWTIDVTLVLTCLLFSIACVRFGEEGEATWGKKDPSQVVADEMAGQSIALLFLPWRASGDDKAFLANAAMAGVAFFAFRFFDILKPPPANALEKLRGGWGILVDDLIAGVFALAVAQAFARLGLSALEW